MAINSLVSPPFYLAGPLTAEGLVLPISANDAAVICALLGSGNHTYMRISSASSLEVVKAQCTGSVVQIDRAINESFAVAHPLGACVTIDMDTICAMSDVVCQELGNCPGLAATLRAALLGDSTFLQSLATNDTFEAALAGNLTFQAALQSGLLGNSTFLPAILSSVRTSLLGDSAFVTSLANSVAASTTFLNNITSAVASSPTLLAAVSNAVLASPNFCSSVLACSSSGGGPGFCQAPTISSVLTPASATVGTAYTGTLTMGPATSVTVLNLPSGLTASYNINTGLLTISGTPVVAGAGTLSVVAVNACGTASPTTRTLALGTITVAAPGGPGDPGACPLPALLSSLTPSTAVAGVPYTGTANVANTTGVSFANLPSWATGTFNQGTQQIVITGTPTAAMSGVTVTLTNACGGALTTSVVSGLPLGNLSVGAPTISANGLQPYIGTEGCGGVPLYAQLWMSNISAPGATGWQVLQSSPAAQWDLPANPGNTVNLLPFSGFNVNASHTLRAVGSWGTTNAISIGHAYLHDDACPEGA